MIAIATAEPTTTHEQRADSTRPSPVIGRAAFAPAYRDLDEGFLIWLAGMRDRRKRVAR